MNHRLCGTVADGRVLLEGLQKVFSTPMYLPVEYQVINADLAFFLREANQDIMRNSSLQVRTECFFVQQARRAPSLSATYGPLSIEQPIPLELLQPPGTSSAFSSSSFSSSTFPLNWKKAPGQAEGTPVELYYMVWATESDECGWEDSRKGGAVRPDLEGMPRGIHGSAPLLRIGSLRLYQSVAALPLDEVRLDLNFAVLVPPIPVQRKGTVSIIVAASGAALVDMFTLRFLTSIPLDSGMAAGNGTLENRVRLTEGVAFLGARPSDPVLWTASQEARNEGHRELLVTFPHSPLSTSNHVRCDTFPLCYPSQALYCVTVVMFHTKHAGSGQQLRPGAPGALKAACPV
ncbi:hypothetical protein Z043_108656 [Scleropages formosus]|uniref:Uncharacterized protein n=1 Tax=Scleropages formosus TaxID=113540 RepID=A0A0P7X625_SCLFO|nr:hypothetical protein Z043_108656 [Scleropages formosus]